VAQNFFEHDSRLIQGFEVTSAPTADRIQAGQAVYTPGLLGWYDWLVLGISNRWIWRCPTPRLLELYDRNITGNHLEVGVGTGYFLDRCRWPSPPQRLVLADLNDHCLSATSGRVARYVPETLHHDVFQPLPAEVGRFDSIGLNYVLHCLPGDLSSKAVVFEHLRAALLPQGVLFGATILAEGVPTSFAARRLMAFYRRQGIFGNARDRLSDLRATLTARFAKVDIDAVGCVARFAAWK
jgi:SAM-dependent methyltransferase